MKNKKKNKYNIIDRSNMMFFCVGSITISYDFVAQNYLDHCIGNQKMPHCNLAWPSWVYMASKVSSAGISYDHLNTDYADEIRKSIMTEM